MDIFHTLQQTLTCLDTSEEEVSLMVIHLDGLGLSSQWNFPRWRRLQSAVELFEDQPELFRCKVRDELESVLLCLATLPLEDFEDDSPEWLFDSLEALESLVEGIEEILWASSGWQAQQGLQNCLNVLYRIEGLEARLAA